MPRLIESDNRELNALGNPQPPDSAGSNLQSLLDSVTHAVDKGDLPLAVRLADRARRIASKNSHCVLLYSRLLIQTGCAKQALELLIDESDPHVLLARGIAFCELGMTDKAFKCCQDLLLKNSVNAIEGLPAFASRICLAMSSSHVTGWVGANDQLHLIGNVERSKRVRVECPEGTFHPVIIAKGQEAFDSFHCVLPESTAGQVRVQVEECEVLGSGFTWPPSFEPSAWVALESGSVVGEAQLNWSPQLPVTLIISNCDSQTQRKIFSKPDRASNSCSFSARLSQKEVEASLLDVMVVLPDGRQIPAIGSPIYPQHKPAALDRTKFNRSVGRRSISESRSAHLRTGVIDIIVPVFAGREETLRCLSSILNTSNPDLAQVLVVNDASPDQDLSETLASLALDNQITLITNTCNLGFAGAVNAGIKHHPDRDVILLNSDTEVFGDWVQRLKKAAYSSHDVGTVTPLGKSGSLTDYLREDTVDSARTQEIDRIAKKVNAGRTIEIPIGVGFCIYIKRACLDETGELDAMMFGKGYGEENDFCLRAKNLGWRHLAAADVFVGHHGGRSFGKSSALLRKRNSRILNALHPGYAALIKEFSSVDPLSAARRAIDMRRLTDKAKKTVLLITHDLPGGVKRHVSQRQTELSASEHTVVVLRRLSSPESITKVMLAVDSLGLEDLLFDLPMDLKLLGNLLREIRLSRIEIHHLLGLPTPFIDMAMELKIPYDIYIHDYSWICPRVTLIDGKGRYCEEGSITGCEACLQIHGSAMEESLTAAKLRERTAKLLRNARRSIVPSADTKERFERFFPQQSFELIAWEDVSYESPQQNPVSDDRVRVAVIGAIGIPKGYQVLLDCARDAVARNLDLEFVVIGYTADDLPLMDTGRVFITGPYQEAEIGMLLERERCNLALFASVTPETWCYSLTHAITRGLPIVAFDLGAQAERLRSYSAATLLPLSSNEQEVNSALIQAIKGHEPLQEQVEKKVSVEHVEFTALPQSEEPKSQELVSSVQVLKLPQGIYSFTVKEGASLADEAEALALPALQVGIAPARSTGKVEFLTGAASLDRWLAFKTDMIVLKIAEGDAMLLLTSVRAQDSPSLSISIDRLNAQADLSANSPQKIEVHTGSLPGSREVNVLAHIRYIGDLTFESGSAGWPGQQMWIEGFAISSVANLPADCIEYRGVVANGFQTPWLGNRALCGSRGGGLPLLGFAVRLKPEVAESHECIYSGKFLSGREIGPLTDGTLCVSDSPNDPLEMIDIHVRERQLLSSLVKTGAIPFEG